LPHPPNAIQFEGNRPHLTRPAAAHPPKHAERHASLRHIVKLADRNYLNGSGLGLTDDFDCHVYLIDGGDELAAVDAAGSA
jgi:hypothetical protein